MVTTQVLDNGLTVVVAPDTSPVVAVQAWVGAGSADDPRGRDGLAHLVEHLTFVRGANRGRTLTAIAEAHGGDANAWTSVDHTVFQAIVPKRGFTPIVCALAAAMQFPALAHAEVERELRVVDAERRLVEQSPRRQVAAALFRTAFVRHPYRRAVVGSATSLLTLDAAAATAFHDRWYCANNLTVVVAGGVTSAIAVAEVAQAFAGWPARALARQRATEPTPIAPRVLVVPTRSERGAGECALGFAVDAETDAPALDLLAATVSALPHGWAGDAARRSSACRYPLRDHAVWAVHIETPLGQVPPTGTRLWRRLRAIVDSLGEDEVAAGRQLLEAEVAAQRETAQGRARHLGQWATRTPSALAHDEEPYARARASTLAEIQAAARRWLRSERASLVGTVPAARAPAADQRWQQALADGRPLRQARRRPPAPRVLAAVTAPATGSGAAVVGVPALTDHRLANGIRVVIEQRPGAGVVATRLVWPGGARAEDPAQVGWTALLARAARRACRRDAAGHDRVDPIAGSLEFTAGRNSLGVSGEWLTRTWREGLAITLACAGFDGITEDDLAAARTELHHERARVAADPASMAFAAFAHHHYGPHAYGRPVAGGPDDVVGARAETLADFAGTAYPTGALTLVVVGDVAREQVLADVQARWGQVAAAPRAHRARQPVVGQAGQRFVAAPVEDAHIVIGLPGTTIEAADRPAVEVMTAALAAPSGRLFAALREQRGLSYRIQAANVEGVDAGYLAIYVAVLPADADLVVAAVREQLERLAADGVSDLELQRLKEYVLGAQAITGQGAAARAQGLAHRALHGLAIEPEAAFDEVRAVDASAVRAAAARYLRWDQAVIATVAPPRATPAATQRSQGPRGAGRPRKRR